jgi:predicted DNA-binding protein
MADTTQTAFRLPAELLARLDRHAERLRQQHAGMTVTRADVVRMLLTRALNDVEKESPKLKK